MLISPDEFRIAARQLRRQPGFAAVVILSLALAIALNTTMYGVLDTLTHPRLDLRHPEQLYSAVLYGDRKSVVGTRTREALLADGMKTYSGVARVGGFWAANALIEHGQNIAEGAVGGVSANYFDVVGPKIIAGRTFLPSDVDAPQSPVVVTENLIAELFPKGGQPVGAQIQIDHQPHVIVGVVSSRANVPHENVTAWLVPPFNEHDVYTRVFRLRPDATLAQAWRELDIVAGRVAALAGENPRDVAFRFHAAADPNFQLGVLHVALIVAVAAVLLVACANLANLQLARGISRRRDLALRAALGATRKRIVAHLLSESILLAGGGLTLGLLLTYLSGKLLAAHIPTSMGDFVVAPHMSWRVLGFALAATVLCLVLIGIAPSVYVSRADPNEMLKSGAGTGATKQNRRRYGLLVGLEIGLALVLASVAVLTVRNALQASQTWYGYDSRPIVTGFIDRSVPPKTAIAYSDLLWTVSGRVRSVHGVADAAAYMSMQAKHGTVTIEDPGGVREFIGAPDISVVSPSFLRTLRRPIVRGRDFLDGQRDAGAVIVDEQTARTLWPNANPVGAQIKLSDAAFDLPFVHVVGVVGEQRGFASSDVPGAHMYGQRMMGRIYYLPGPADSLVTSKYGYVFAWFVARAESHPETLPIAIRRAGQAWADVNLRGVISMDERLGLALQRQNTAFISSLFTLFAFLGVLLAAFGVYGVVAHGVAERRRELGVRIALGATARDVLHAVLRESVVVALSGVALGLFITKFAVKHLDKLILEDDVFNAPVFASVAAALILAAAIAALVPAMRATRVDPTESLRND